MYNWFDKAKNKSSVVIKDTKTEKSLTLYKVSKGTYLITNGDAEYARRTYNQKLLAATAGGVNPRKDALSPVVGYVTTKVLKGAMAKLSE
ncbi:MAG: hypothetical protein NC308_06340 [Clostridium sp.]|nr:hypothetical protein [Bacteroides sp.]MCM1198490.1 hypothetical protein [Clostridium sp.]